MSGMVPIGPFREWLDGYVAAAQERVSTVHEHVACPRCGAPVGERCWDMRHRRERRKVKDPHRERLHAAGFYER